MQIRFIFVVTMENALGCFTAGRLCWPVAVKPVYVVPVLEAGVGQ